MNGKFHGTPRTILPPQDDGAARNTKAGVPARSLREIPEFATFLTLHWLGCDKKSQ